LLIEYNECEGQEQVFLPYTSLGHANQACQNKYSDNKKDEKVL